VCNSPARHDDAAHLDTFILSEIKEIKVIFGVKATEVEGSVTELNNKL